MQRGSTDFATVGLPICPTAGTPASSLKKRREHCSVRTCSIRTGTVEPLSSADVVGRSRQAMKEYQAGILAEYVPYTPHTAQNLKKLAELNPKTLAIMHGSSFTGDCARALGDLNVMLREVFGPKDWRRRSVLHRPGDRF